MNRSLTFLVLFLIAFAGLAKADTVDITLSTNPPPISSELSGYIAAASLGGIHRVGFNAADIGQGSGDGLNEMVAFSFVYNPILLPIASATITLDLTKPSVLDTSDLLLFADNNTPSPIFDNGSMDPYYGNASLGTLSPGTSAVITLDLKNMSTNDGFLGVFGSEDLTNLLLDGDLNVVYWEDATIHSARLRINLVPEPTASVMVLSLAATAIAVRSRRRTTTC